MKAIRVSIVLIFAAFGSSGAFPGAGDISARGEVDSTAVRLIEVEGVTARRQAAPIAALREIGGRLLGEPFLVVDGKYVTISEGMFSPPVDTKAKKLLSLEHLETGLFKARVEVQTTPELAAVTDRLRERVAWGGGTNVSDDAPILVRSRARRDAVEKAVLDAVKEHYPGGSAPRLLEGRVFFLGTVLEKIEGKGYRIMARVKVLFVSP